MNRIGRLGQALILHGVMDTTRPDEADALVQAEAVATALRHMGYRPRIEAIDLDLSRLAKLARPRGAGPVSLIFNLVEALGGDGTLIHLPAAAMESLGLTFTGASAKALYTTTDKILTKQLLKSACLPTPSWSRTGRGFHRDDQVIVKSISEDASFGLDAGSVVPARGAAQEVLARQARFGGRWFAERFIEGREFNLSVLETAGGPRVLPAAEIEFRDFPADRPHIVDYEAKWSDGAFAFENTPRVFPGAEDEALKNKLSALALATWQRFDLKGYARVDFRVDQAGRPWILEVNANPCLAPDAGFVAAAAKAGLSYDALIAQIVSSAAGAGQLRAVA